jgi:shikimate dehydrogenase
MINAKTKLNIVIGYPLSHTQSPLLHNNLYQSLYINAVLLAFANKDLKLIIATIKTLAVELTAVTMSFKEEILSYVDTQSPEVKVLKAANTIIQRDGKLHAYNTDTDGIAYALREISVTDKQVLILGAGGSARAVGYFLRQHKARILWSNRTLAKAIDLKNHFGGEIINTQDINKLSPDIIINTTPIGMMPEINFSPLENYKFKSHQIIFDIIYNPSETKLLKEASQQGAQIINGLEMFVGQGIKQIELWTGQDITSETEKIKSIIKILQGNLK